MTCRRVWVREPRRSETFQTKRATFCHRTRPEDCTLVCPQYKVGVVLEGFIFCYSDNAMKTIEMCGLFSRLL